MKGCNKMKDQPNGYVLTSLDLARLTEVKNDIEAIINGGTIMENGFPIQLSDVLQGDIYSLNQVIIDRRNSSMGDE